MLIQPDDVVLFQGDSITDAGRSRDHQTANDPLGLGFGYAFHTAAMLHEALPAGNLAIHNRGVGGDRVTNLHERWPHDTLDLNPDVLSILIGVNDTWHGIASGTPENGVPLEQFQQTYEKILTDAKSHNPHLKLILCDPFALPCGQVNDKWFPDFTDRREIVKSLADQFDAVFVPFQAMFDKALDRAEADAWAYDGVHPTLAGHMLMAKTWLQTVTTASA